MTPLQALQKALAAEHAAVFLFGVLGARTSKSQDPQLFRRLTRAFEDHRATRDDLTVRISGHDADPVAALVDYAVPGPIGSPAQVEVVARTVEQRVTRTYGEVVAHTVGDDRRWAVAELDTSALRGLSFGVPASDFPGID